MKDTRDKQRKKLSWRRIARGAAALALAIPLMGFGMKVEALAQPADSLQGVQRPALQTALNVELLTTVQTASVMRAAEDISKIPEEDREKQPFWGQTTYPRSQIEIWEKKYCISGTIMI